MGSCLSHFNVSLIVWTKSQDSVHKPQFLKRRERRAKADRTKILLLTSQALTARPHRLTSKVWKGGKHWALRPHKPLRLFRDGEAGRGGGSGFFISNTYSLHCHHQNDCMKVGSCVSHNNVPLLVWEKSQDSVQRCAFFFFFWLNAWWSHNVVPASKGVLQAAPFIYSASLCCYDMNLPDLG